MAAEDQLPEFCSESARLREEIVNLITRRLEESIPKKSKNIGVAKVLCKRKRKWRKKHKLDAIKPVYKAVDHQLRSEKETTEDAHILLKDVLFRRRQEAFALARQLEKQKGDYQLESISYRLQVAQDTFKANLPSQQNVVPPVEPELSCAEQLDQLLAEIEGAMTQASALSNIRQMKHTMTPRFPPLHNRTLSGNILDTTLGVLHTPDHLEVDSSPMDTTNIAPELHAIDQDSEAEVDERLEMTHVCEKEMVTGSNSFSLQETHREDGSRKTYANVRLSTESVPLQLASSSVNNEASRLVKTNPQSNLEIDTASKHVLPLSDISVVDYFVMDVDAVHETKMCDSQIVDPTHIHVTAASAIGEMSSLQEDDKASGGTYTKNTPVIGNSQTVVDSSHPVLCQDEEVRAITEHSYAMVCSVDGIAQRGAAACDNTFIVSPNQKDDHQLVSGDHSMIAASQGCETGMMREALELNTDTIQEIEDGAHLKCPLVVEGSRMDGFSHPPMHSGGEEELLGKNIVHNSEGVIDDGLHEPMALLPSIIGDEVLEVTVIEPKSDVPMPVEYTVVTQQEITEEPPPKEETPPPMHHDYDKTHLVNEDGNEPGESIMIGCEVTTSTMELTDVTDFNGGSIASASERQIPAAEFTLADDISCETVIITTSAMNSTRSGGYTTPSEDSDGTTNSLEEKETRGDGAGPADGKQINNMMVTNDTGTDSDVVFEDILKQIESAPYELRISNIVLAQLSRAASKSPPLSSKKKRKRSRRSTAKRWTKRKSTTNK